MMKSYTHSAFWAGTTYVVGIVSMLARNVIFARMLSPENFSVALTFGVVLSFFEYASNFGHELLMQRSKDGFKPKFQATMHSLSILRGVSMGLILLLIAPFIPSLFNLSDETFNYGLLAIVPLIKGFEHLDPRRAHRINNYVPLAKIGLIADTLSIVIALVCVIIIDSYWAFYISFVFRHSVGTLLSHHYAFRPYQLAFETQYALRLWNFGFPLIIVGVLKYLGTEADKTLIAHYSGLSNFAVYFLALMLTANAANIISIGLGKIFVRRVSMSSDATLNITAFHNGVVSLYLVLPILFLITIFGEDLIHLIFGEQYLMPPFLFPVVVTLIAFRHLNLWLNQVVVGKANTRLMLYSDLFRVSSLILLIPWVISYQDMRVISLVFAVSEVAYFACLNYLLATQHFKHIYLSGLKLLLTVCLCLPLFALTHWLLNSQPLLVKILYSGMGVLLIMGTFYIGSSVCRLQTQRLKVTALSLFRSRTPHQKENSALRK